MRSSIGLGVIAMAGVAVAAPRPITVKVKGAQLFDVAHKLSEQSGCKVSGFGLAKVDLDVTNASLWEVLARLEADGIRSQFQHGQVLLDSTSAPARSFSAIDPQPTWARHWRSTPEWAVALIGDSTAQRARLVVLGMVNGTIDKVVIDKAAAGAKQLKVAPGVPVVLAACDPAAVVLDLGASATKLTIRGHVVVKVPKMIEKRVVVPLDDSVVDIAEGRLRIHVASLPQQGGRSVLVNWDGMGTPVRVEVSLVDDTGAPLSTSGRGSGYSSSGQSHETYHVSATAKPTVILRIPGGASTEVKVPFKFDNETLDPPTRP